MKGFKQFVLMVFVISTFIGANSSVSIASELRGGDCKSNMDVIDTLRHAFPREDGTLSRRYQWAVLWSNTEFEYRGSAVLRGRVPRDFIVDGNTEGAKIELNKSATVWCFPDPGTAHTKTPPAHCPTTPREAFDQIGGRLKWWSLEEESHGPAVYRYLMYYPYTGQNLPSFTVPLQSRVHIWESGRDYTTGYTVPSRKRRIMLHCLGDSSQ